MNEEKNIEGLNKFLKIHPTFQLALLEAVHRYYYDECFTKGEGSRFKGDEETNFISELHHILYCLSPSWRTDIKKKLERYHSGERTNALLAEYKPKRKIELNFNLSVLLPKEQD